MKMAEIRISSAINKVTNTAALIPAETVTGMPKYMYIVNRNRMKKASKCDMFVNLPDISCSNISLGVQDPKKSSGMEIKLALSVEIATRMIKIGNKST